MKKSLSLPVLLAAVLIGLSSFAAAFSVYISGPDSQCSLENGSYGEWTIYDYEPGSTFQWYINDADSRELGYPSYGFGRPAFDIDDTLNGGIAFTSGSTTVYDVVVTCKVTTNGVVHYEGFTVTSCE